MRDVIFSDGRQSIGTAFDWSIVVDLLGTPSVEAFNIHSEELKWNFQEYGSHF